MGSKTDDIFLLAQTIHGSFARLCRESKKTIPDIEDVNNPVVNEIAQYLQTIYTDIGGFLNNSNRETLETLTAAVNNLPEYIKTNTTVKDITVRLLSAASEIFNISNEMVQEQNSSENDQSTIKGAASSNTNFNSRQFSLFSYGKSKETKEEKSKPSNKPN